MDTTLKCEVCSEPTEIVASSWLGAFSTALCERCIIKGCQPYWSLLATAEMCHPDKFGDNEFPGFVPEFKESVLATLEVMGKGLNEFWRDVEALIDETNEYFANLPEADGTVIEYEDDPFK